MLLYMCRQVFSHLSSAPLPDHIVLPEPQENQQLWLCTIHGEKLHERVKKLEDSTQMILSLPADDNDYFKG